MSNSYCKCALPFSSFPYSEFIMFIYLFNSVFKTGAEDQTQNFIYARRGLYHWDPSSAILYFHFCMSAPVSSDAHCGPRTASGVSPPLPPCLEAGPFVASVLWIPSLPGLGISSFHLPSWGHWGHRHYIAVSSFYRSSGDWLEARSSSWMCIRHLTHWISYPAETLFSEGVLTYSYAGPLKCSR